MTGRLEYFKDRKEQPGRPTERKQVARSTEIAARLRFPGAREPTPGGGLEAPIRRRPPRPLAPDRPPDMLCSVSSLDRLIATLAAGGPEPVATVTPSTASEPASAQAAVAAVFREQRELELLFIRRAEHPLDPWSGHMAFPGGRVDLTDPDALAAALRETREELDLDLERAGRLLGRLPEVPAIARGRRVPLVIQPFVFTLDREPDPAFLPSDEVAEAIWVPFSFLAEPRHRERLRYRREGVEVELPCYRYQGREIWGLTLRMVDEMLRRVGA